MPSDAQSAPVAAPESAPAVKIEPHLLEPQQRIKLTDPTPPAEPTEAGPAEGAGDTPPPAPPQEPTKPALNDPRFQEQFSTLAKRAKALRDREEAMKRDVADLERLRKIEERLKSRDYGVVKEYGGSLDEWSEKWLVEQGEKPNPVAQKLRETERQLAELAEWKKAQEQERESSETKRAREQVEQARAQFQTQIDEKLSSSDEYKVLTVAGLGREVFAVIDAHAARTRQELGTPHVLEIEEAAKYVKDYWVPKLKETLKGLAGLPEFSDVLEELTKAKVPPAGNEPGGASANAQTQEIQGQRARPATALTNEQAATAPPRALDADRRLTRDEKIRAAASKLQFV